MKTVIIIFSMIFLHIIDDYHLQGNLTLFKQKSWWKENYPDKKYKYDFLMALYIHSFSWTFMIHVPIMISYILGKEINTILFIIVFLLNLIIHMYVDHLKCNDMKLNLIQDQMIHLLQIIITAFIYLRPF